MIQNGDVGSTHSHVGLAPDVGFCERLFELARDAEIAELDVTLSVDEDVGGLDVWVGSVTGWSAGGGGGTDRDG